MLPPAYCKPHQEQTGLDSTNLLNALNLLNDTDATNVTSGNVSLSVSRFPDIIGSQTINGMPVPVPSNSSFSVTFDWTLSQNGVTESLVALSFDNGIFYDLQDQRATNSSTSNPIAAAQESATSLSTTPQPTNGTSPQTNQLQNKSSQKTADAQNELVITLVITAIIAYVIMVIVVLTYKSKNQANKSKGEVSKRD